MPSNIPAIDTTQPYNSAGVIVSNIPMDIREQYRLGNNISVVPGLGPVAVMDQPFSSLALEKQRYNNFIDARNLSGATYQPAKVPAFIPGSTLINTVGNFIGGLGYEKNKSFFAENVAGKYGYGYGLEDYNQYMQDRLSGKVSAYGNPDLGQNAINKRSRGDNRTGIMEVASIAPIDDNILETPYQEDLTEDMYFNFGTYSNPIYKKDLV